MGSETVSRPCATVGRGSPAIHPLTGVFQLRANRSVACANLSRTISVITVRGGCVTKSVGLTAARGEIAVTTSMEKLQDAYLGAIAAAAGCELSKPDPDPGLDWTIGLKSSQHTKFKTAKIDVALKSTYQHGPNDNGQFSFTLKNEHHNVLSEELLLYPRLLVVMVLPSDVDAWVWSRSNWMIMRHSMYWLNLKGAKLGGEKTTNVRVPYAQRFDALELCRILHSVGSGGSP